MAAFKKYSIITCHVKIPPLSIFQSFILMKKLLENKDFACFPCLFFFEKTNLKRPQIITKYNLTEHHYFII